MRSYWETTLLGHSPRVLAINFLVVSTHTRACTAYSAHKSEWGRPWGRLLNAHPPTQYTIYTHPPRGYYDVPRHKILWIHVGNDI